MRRSLIAAVGLLGFLGLAAPARAGWYLAPEARWGVFAARPEAGENTPNYYGYGGTLSFGYSPRQMVDIGAYGSYLPGALKHAEIGKDDATLVSYGGELGFRIADAVYLGFRGGPDKYRLNQPSDDPERPELAGKWTGVCGGLSLGAVMRASKQFIVQTTLDVMHHVVKQEDEPELGKRRFDEFSVGLTFMLNSHKAYLIENSIFKDYLDSIVFW